MKKFLFSFVLMGAMLLVLSNSPLANDDLTQEQVSLADSKWKTSYVPKKKSDLSDNNPDHTLAAHINGFEQKLKQQFPEYFL